MRLLLLLTGIGLTACNPYRSLSSSAEKGLLRDSSLLHAHTGISVFEPATGKFIYEHQAEKYFVPASNTKIPTCYAAMKFLGDSLVGARIEERWDGTLIYGTGDPSFLHPEFAFQPLWDYLQTQKGKTLSLVLNTDSTYNTNHIYRAYGPGWSWSDYAEAYMPERSFFPVYGNVARFSIGPGGVLQVIPGYFRRQSQYTPEIGPLQVSRELAGNNFMVRGNSGSATVPFKTMNDHYGVGLYSFATTDSLLSDTLGVPVQYKVAGSSNRLLRSIKSQPTDSLLKPMMHRSDNFYAEQSLLMAALEHTGIMNERLLIDSILKTDFSDLPQRPRWVDGSGLSRYNLFSPKDMVLILDKMRSGFGMERLMKIFPTAGEGTISGYYKGLEGKIFAKTGTLSGVVALSGYLYTKSNRLLIFSVLVNNHNTSASQVRRAIEKFIRSIHHKF